jgi:hypothetical protein
VLRKDYQRLSACLERAPWPLQKVKIHTTWRLESSSVSPPVTRQTARMVPPIHLYPYSSTIAHRSFRSRPKRQRRPFGPVRISRIVLVRLGRLNFSYFADIGPSRRLRNGRHGRAIMADNQPGMFAFFKTMMERLPECCIRRLFVSVVAFKRGRPHSNQNRRIIDSSTTGHAICSLARH